MGKCIIGILVFVGMYLFATCGFFMMFAGPCPHVDLGPPWGELLGPAFMVLQVLFWAFALSWMIIRIHRWRWESRTSGRRLDPSTHRHLDTSTQPLDEDGSTRTPTR